MTKDPFQERGSGKTCLSALSTGKIGTIAVPINNSKGCGGIMRISPVGLLFQPDFAFQVGAQCAAITHGHPSGYLSAGFLSSMIAFLVRRESLTEAIQSSCMFLTKYQGHQEPLMKIQQAIQLQKNNLPAEEAISQIGQGWVGEEALGISLYCILKYPHNWTKAVLAAANHSGDSDSTASLAGCIAGTLLGYDFIPSRWVQRVENSEKIKNLAYCLYQIAQKKDKQRKKKG